MVPPNTGVLAFRIGSKPLKDPLGRLFACRICEELGEKWVTSGSVARESPLDLRFLHFGSPKVLEAAPSFEVKKKLKLVGEPLEHRFCAVSQRSALADVLENASKRLFQAAFEALQDLPEHGLCEEHVQLGPRGEQVHAREDPDGERHPGGDQEGDVICDVYKMCSLIMKSGEHASTHLSSLMTYEVDIMMI